MKHYFAYGTLLDIKSMRALTPSAQSLGLMQLDGYRMGFAKCRDRVSGGCTLIEEAGAVLYGVQYRMSDADMAALDTAAGVDAGLWAHRPVQLTDSTGTTHHSSTYFIPNATGPDAPTDEYVAPIYQGLKDLPFPDAYVVKMKQIIRDARATA